MKPIIHNAVHAALTEAPRRQTRQELWASDLGKNPYSAVRRLMTGELEPFDYATLLKMDGGNALEAFTLRQVAENIGRPVRTQFPLFDGIWSGYADLVIGHGTSEVIIVDHKASAGKWWDYRESLPRASDMCQVWLYGQLYEQMYGVEPALRLYYRGWGAWAEFEVKADLEFHEMNASGQITDEKGAEAVGAYRTRYADPQLLKMEMESFYRRVMGGEISEAELAAMDPGGPDWDYAEKATRRLVEQFKDEH